MLAEAKATLAEVKATLAGVKATLAGAKATLAGAKATLIQSLFPLRRVVVNLKQLAHAGCSDKMIDADCQYPKR